MKSHQLVTASLGILLLQLITPVQAQEITKTGKAKETARYSTNQRQAAGSGMQGAYAMLLQMVNDGTRDSMINVHQFKIYTDRHFMYAHALPGDSLAYFGIGTYRMENDKLIEYPFYTSSGGAQDDTVAIRVTRLGNGYVQVINFPPDSQGRKYILTEEYGNVSNALYSPLDGAWKQIKSTFIPKTGTAVTTNQPTQFKVFQAGHFMWASTVPDSATGKSVSYFGYGTFEMNGRNETRERTTNSTFRTALIGKPVRVQLAFQGRDAFQQTILWPDGKSVESYQRLK